MTEERPDVRTGAAGETPALPVMPPGQLELLAGESDEALLVPAAEAAKRFTATTAAKLEQRRRHILDLLAFNVPITWIASRCGCSHRIVTLLGAKYAQEVATDAVAFAQVLKAKAASFLFFAEQKAPDAKFGELMVGVGIATQRATEMEVAANAVLSAESNDGEMETVNDKLEKFRAGLKQLAPGPAGETPAGAGGTPALPRREDA